MTDPQEEAPEIAEVRRLLAEARHTEPIPAEVAARMDDVLAGLARGEDSLPGSPAADVVDLPSARRRRRRRWAGSLVAAAAVVVAVAVVPHLSLSSSSSSSSSSSGSAAADEALGNTGNNQAAPSTSPRAPGVPVVVHPRHFAADARAARVRLAHAGRATSQSAQLASTCLGVPAGGHAVPAQYRRAPAVLFYRPAHSGRQVVDLYLCGSAHPVRSVSLPAR